MAKLANSNKQELIKASRESVSKYRYVETKNNMRRRWYDTVSCFKKKDMAMIFSIIVDGNSEYLKPR